MAASLRISRISILLAAMALALMAGKSAPAVADSPADGDWVLLEPMVVEQLDNGMTFLLYPTRRAPIFSGVIRYDVGGKDEVPGTTGIAHMFEHMAFKGTRHIGTTDWRAEQKALERLETAAYACDALREEIEALGLAPEAAEAQLAPVLKAFEDAKTSASAYVVKDEFDEIYNREGGSQMNATTGQDATTYFISLPANRIDLWAKMESERLGTPVMRDFYSERDVVKEERRMRTDNSPIGRLWELLNAMAFTAHPYALPTIGWEADIRNLKATDAYEFYRANYTPDRAVGVIVGDIDVEATRVLLRETFGKIPPRDPGLAARRMLPEPPQLGERRGNLELEATPFLMMGWHKPNSPDAADLRAEVLAQALTGGRSARWFERFVKQDRLAADLGLFTGPGDAQPNLLIAYASPQGETTLAEVEKALREDIGALHEELIDEATLARAKKTLRADTIRALETNLGLAQRLAETALISGDPYYLERRMRQLGAVTAEDLREFVREYLNDTNLTVATLQPTAKAAEEVAETADETDADE